MRALVLSGGASKGAYQFGALKYLMGDLNIKYDIHCGISVGALNSAMLGMFSKEENNKSLEFMSEQWNKVDTSKIYKRWFPFGRLHALWKSSLYNSEPLQKWVKGYLDIELLNSSNKQIVVGAVSLSTGEYRLFNQNYANFVEAVIASASYPGVLCPAHMENQIWSDGGVKEITPLKAAIDLGATDIDIIICAPEQNHTSFSNKPNSIDVLKRTIDLMTDEIVKDDVEKAILYNKLVLCGQAPGKKLINLNIIRPDYNPTEDSLNFSQEEIQKMIKHGYKDAKIKYKY